MTVINLEIIFIYLQCQI